MNLECARVVPISERFFVGGAAEQEYGGRSLGHDTKVRFFYLREIFPGWTWGSWATFARAWVIV